MARARRTWFWVLRHTLNPVVLGLARAGRGPFSLVRHVGRRTGRAYETPLLLARVREGFVAELTYGEDVDWYRNVVAAGGGGLLVGGVSYRIASVEGYPTEAGRRAFGFPARYVLALLRRREFRLLRVE